MKQATNSPQSVDSTAQRLAEYVGSHLSKPSIAEACMLLGLTRRTLQRRLYETGTSFQKVVIATRISVAEKLLSETSSPITRIASDVGFATLQAFSSAFRRETGLSPSGYRSAALKVPASDARAADRSEPAHERAAALDDRDLLDGFETITSPPPASGARLIANESLKIAASG